MVVNGVEDAIKNKGEILVKKYNKERERRYGRIMGYI